MHRSSIAILFAVLIPLVILSAIGLTVLYSATARRFEPETCPAVERYFAAEREANATLDTNGLEKVATGGALLTISSLVEGHIKNNDGLYLTTTVEHCRLAFPLFPDESFVHPSASKVSLDVGFTTTYFGTDPNAAVSQPLDVGHWVQLFLVTKVDERWKVSEIVSPRSLAVVPCRNSDRNIAHCDRRQSNVLDYSHSDFGSADGDFLQTTLDQ